MTGPSPNGSTQKTAPKHHLDVATLMSFAAGSLPEALAVVAAQHIDQCPSCARDLRRMEMIGSSLLATCEPAALTLPAPTLAARLHREPRSSGAGVGAIHAEAAVARDGGPRLARGYDLSRVQWRRLGLGIWHAPVPLSAGARGDLRLIKVAPGRQLPEHGHGGSELTLILDGSYTDELGTFGAGDIADLDETVEHQPVADSAVGCVCLIAFEQRARFKGLLPRLMQPLTGM